MIEIRVISSHEVEVSECRRWRSTDMFKRYRKERFNKDANGHWHGEFRRYNHFLDDSIETFVSISDIETASYQRRWLIAL